MKIAPAISVATTVFLAACSTDPTPEQTKPGGPKRIAFHEAIIHVAGGECAARLAAQDENLELILPVDPPNSTLWRVSTDSQEETSIAGNTPIVMEGTPRYDETIAFVDYLKAQRGCILDAFPNYFASMNKSNYTAYLRPAPPKGDAGTTDPARAAQWHLNGAMNSADASTIAHGGPPGSEDLTDIRKSVTVGVVDQRFNFVASAEERLSASVMFFEEGTTACEGRNYEHIRLNGGEVDHGEWVLGAAFGCTRDGQSVSGVDRYSDIVAVEGATTADFLVGLSLVSDVDICASNKKLLGDNQDICDDEGFVSSRHKTDVVSTSFLIQTIYFKAALKLAAEFQTKGIVWVAGAGNNMEDVGTHIYRNTNNALMSLATVPTIVGVGASEPVQTSSGAFIQGKLAFFSDWGKDVDILAPGTLIYQETKASQRPKNLPYEYPKSGWAYLFLKKKKSTSKWGQPPTTGTAKGYVNGTSFASPVVASVVSLMKRVDRSLNGARAQYILEATANPVTLAQYCENFGVPKKDNNPFWANTVVNLDTLEVALTATSEAALQTRDCKVRCAASSSGGGQACTSGFIDAGKAVALTEKIAAWESKKAGTTMPAEIATAALIQADTYLLDEETTAATFTNVGWVPGEVTLFLPPGVTANGKKDSLELGSLKPTESSKPVEFEWDFDGIAKDELPLFAPIRATIGAPSLLQSEVSVYIQTQPIGTEK